MIYVLDMLALRFVLLVSMALAWLLPQASADLVLTLTGNTGSGTVQWSATGTGLSVGTPVTGIGPTSSGRMPTEAGTPPEESEEEPEPAGWETEWDNNIGDALKDFPTSANESLVLSDGGIEVTRTESSSGMSYVIGYFDRIDFDPDLSGGGALDDIEPNPSSGAPITYPTLAAGDVVSWSGSGTLDLDSGYNFEDVFNPGTYQKVHATGSYEVNVVNLSAVPEPSGFLLSLVVISVAFRRRRARQSFC